MRISIALTLLILALGVPLGWQNQQQLASARERHGQLFAKATQSGIIHHLTRRPDEMRVTRRERENKEEVAKKLASDFITAEKDDKQGEAQQDLISDMLTSVASLNTVQVKILFAEVLASKELTDGARQKLLFSLVEVVSDHPQIALALLTESVDLSKEIRLGKDLIASSLPKWAREDPLAALEWVRKNGEIFSKFMDGNSKVRMISSAAANDPGLAFQLVDGLGLDARDKISALSEIAQAPENPEARTATLAAISAHLAALPPGTERDNLSDQLISGVINNAAKDGFDAGSKWLDQAGFTAKQLERLPHSNLVMVARLAETGKWVEWMGKTHPGGDTEWYMKEMVRHWTETDYQAAGEWLASAPAGSAKNVSISAFAVSVSSHDPQTAEQWAMTLPPSEGRDNILKKIYGNWPENHEAAKETFAKTHGLK